MTKPEKLSPKIITQFKCDNIRNSNVIDEDAMTFDIIQNGVVIILFYFIIILVVVVVVVCCLNSAIQ